MAALFVGLLVGVILIVGGLTFFPALALGPIVEHLAMIAGQTFCSGADEHGCRASARPARRLDRARSSLRQSTLA